MAGKTGLTILDLLCIDPMICLFMNFVMIFEDYFVSEGIQALTGSPGVVSLDLSSIVHI